MEISIDEFFELLTDNKPHYIDEIEEIYDYKDEIISLKPFIKYKQFKSSDEYHAYLAGLAPKVLLKFTEDYSLGIINNGYLTGYLKYLKLDQLNFQRIQIMGIEFLHHKRAIFTSEFIDPINPDTPIEPSKIFSSEKVREIQKYNEYRLEIQNFLIEAIEGLINEDLVASSPGTENLILHVPLADIALLFRLLQKFKVFSAKHQTHIYRVIRNSFKSDDNSVFNEGSIKNAYNDTEPSSVKNLEILLANMKAELKKK